MKSRKILEKELIVKDYIEIFDQEKINSINENNEYCVIGCGVDIEDNVLYLITSNLEIRKITPNGEMIPVSAKLLDKHFIEVKFQQGNSFKINSELALKVSDDCIKNNEILIGDQKLFEINS